MDVEHADVDGGGLAGAELRHRSGHLAADLLGDLADRVRVADDDGHGHVERAVVVVDLHPGGPGGATELRPDAVGGPCDEPAQVVDARHAERRLRRGAGGDHQGPGVLGERGGQLGRQVDLGDLRPGVRIVLHGFLLVNRSAVAPVGERRPRSAPT